MFIRQMYGRYLNFFLAGHDTAVVDVSSLTNDELRQELMRYGDHPRPVTGENTVKPVVSDHPFR